MSHLFITYMSSYAQTHIIVHDHRQKSYKVDAQQMLIDLGQQDVP